MSHLWIHTLLYHSANGFTEEYGALKEKTPANIIEARIISTNRYEYPEKPKLLALTG